MDFNMELNDIIKSINGYFKTKFPNNKGWFIGRMMIIPQTIKLYKRYCIEIYYHTDSENKLILKQELTKRVSSDQENKIKTEVLTSLLTEILTNKNCIDECAI